MNEANTQTVKTVLRSFLVAQLAFSITAAAEQYNWIFLTGGSCDSKPALNDRGWVAVSGNNRSGYIFGMGGIGTVKLFHPGPLKVTSLDNEGRVAGALGPNPEYAAFVTGPRGDNMINLNGTHLGSEAVVGKTGGIAITYWDPWDPSQEGFPLGYKQQSTVVGAIGGNQWFNVGPVANSPSHFQRYVWRTAGIAVNSSLQVIGAYPVVLPIGSGLDALYYRTFVTQPNGQVAVDVTPPTTNYRVHITPNDINDHGQIVAGISNLGVDQTGIFTDRAGQVHFLNFNPESINNAGQIVGKDIVLDVDGSSYNLRQLGTPPSDIGEFIQACRINNKGDILATSNNRLYLLTKDPVPKLPVPDDPSNLGPTCGNTQSCGQPINPATGNMWHIEPDYANASPASGLELTRVYNSSPYNWDAAVSRSFGVKWTHRYEKALRHERPFALGASPGICTTIAATGATFCQAPLAAEPSPIPAAVSVSRGDGKRIFFQNSGTSFWLSKGDVNDRLSPVFNKDKTKIEEWMYFSANDGITERYNATGLLISLAQRNGGVQLLTYSDGINRDNASGRAPADAPVCAQDATEALLPAGRLLCVTDSSGRQLQFRYDIKGRISKVIDPMQQSYQYEYDGPSAGCSADHPDSQSCENNVLTKVTYPGGGSRTYYYNEASKINGGTPCPGSNPIGNGYGHLHSSWTGLIDENGNRHITWSYDCKGNATSSAVGNGGERVVLDYSDPSSNSVTYFTGPVDDQKPSVSRLEFSQIYGTRKTTSVTAQCAECGNFAERKFDINGNVIQTRDWNDTYTCYSYERPYNTETSRIEGSSVPCGDLMSATTLAPPIRKISTRWHSTHRLPSGIAEPNRITSYLFHATGQISAIMEQATSDETGVLGFSAKTVGDTLIRSFSYNAVGQLLEAKGPRNETTRYIYDSANNLTSITNAAGHTTTLSNYDLNGHVGRVVTPSGLTYDFTYYPGGWLASLTITADSHSDRTEYEYDAAGQLTRTSFSDGTTLQYMYDDAHRLVGISDAEGNSVRYLLDVRGNRLSEETIRVDGVLARKISRQFDFLGRVLQQTGAAK